jgi:hypothetical protein
MIEVTEQQILDELVGKLATVYRVAPAQVNRVVLEEYTRFEGEPIRDFVPLFEERNPELAKIAD